MNFVDLLAVLPFYLEILLPMIGVDIQTSAVRVIRIIRLARLAKLSRSDGMSDVLTILTDTLHETMGATGTMLTALVFMEIVIFSSLVFVCEKGVKYEDCPKTRTECDSIDFSASCAWEDGKCEGLYLRSDGQPTPFTSIPQTMWWCMQTITTVGYGDLAPIENWGQVFGFITMITGVIVIALVVIIIGGNFERSFAALRSGKSK